MTKWPKITEGRFDCTLRGALALMILTIIAEPFRIQVMAQEENTLPQGPYLTDPNLTVQTVVTGLRLPTDMEFLSENDLLVLEKNYGTVRRIVNDTLLPEPLLNVPVASLRERGMLGIAASTQGSQNTSIFLYFTESPTFDGADLAGVPPLGNRLYKYDLQDGRLVNGQLLLDLPAVSSYHNGGKIKIGPDDNLYLVVGDQQDPGQVPQLHRTTTQNVRNSIYPDGTAGILRMTQDGKAVENILGGKYPADLYYAYGIRNSFGIAFDPVTNKLWDTENGPDRDDEINLVEPGFNSGWRIIQGLADSPGEISELVEFPGLSTNDRALYGLIEQAYFKFQGLGGKYRDPEFVWRNTVVPTGIVFLNSEKLGKEYQNDLFVGSFKHGIIYNFNLNDDRTSLELSGPLADKIANSPDGYEDIIFGRNFGPIVDLEVGPDGYLYVLSLDGSLYRILAVDDDDDASVISISTESELSPASDGAQQTSGEITTDTGGVLVLIDWTPAQLAAGDESVLGLEFHDAFTGDIITDSVTYNLRILDPEGNTVHLLADQVAENGTSSHTLTFPANENYIMEVEVTAIAVEGQAPDLTRSGIARGIVVVPEFAAGAMLALAVVVAGALGSIIAFQRLARKP